MTKSDSSPDKAAEVAPDVSAEAVGAQLDKLLLSDDFGKSERMKSFLRFIVSETLAGGADRLKEYPIAIEVFGRNESFDPKTSAIVRVEASRLRHRLREYFSGRGREDPIHIALPVGTYIPEFTVGDSTRAEGAAHSEVETPLAYPDKPSIAVLPFTNISDEAEQEFFADGVAEDLITALSRARWLFVIARNSTFAYKGHSPDMRDVGRDLGVRYLVEGSVRKSGGRIRISAQLIDATTGAHLWADRYDRQLADLFDLQDEITETVVAAIESELGEAERERALRKPPDSLDAWESYQRGLWHLYRLTAAENREARKHFGRAVELDPSYAPSHAAIAYSHFLDVIDGFSPSPENSARTAYETARKAVALDNKEPMTHFALGRAFQLMNDFDAAIAELSKAIERDPNFAPAYLGLALCLSFAGRPVEAVAAANYAERLSPRDPLSWAIQNARMIARLLLGEYDLAAQDGLEACRHPNAGMWPFVNLASAQGHLGRAADARATFENVRRLHPDFCAATARLTHSPLKRDQDPEFFGVVLAGLRKAGLDIPDESTAAD
jgi:adenylate cyclase